MYKTRIDNLCPCKDCTIETGRSPTCHSTCEKYEKWRKMKDEENAKIKRSFMIDNLSHTKRKK